MIREMQKFTQRNPRCIIVFGTTYSTITQELARSFEKNKIPFLFVDTERSYSVIQDLSLRFMPTVHVYDEGLFVNILYTEKLRLVFKKFKETGDFNCFLPKPSEMLL